MDQEVTSVSQSRIQNGNSFGLGGYGKSVRRLIISSAIIGMAIWYSGRVNTVNIVEVPVITDPSSASPVDVTESS